jgi:large subunit ribosomal protein L24e
MNCHFCNKAIPEGTGILFVKKDGTSYNFCSSKCEKNQIKLKRKSAKIVWAKKSKKSKSLDK